MSLSDEAPSAELIRRLERRLQRSEAAREEAEQIIESRSRELLHANEQLMEREAELRQRLDIESQHLLRAQRTAGLATFHRHRADRLLTSPEFNTLLGLEPAVRADEQALRGVVHPLDQDRLMRLEASFSPSNHDEREQTHELRIVRRGAVRWTRWVVHREADEQGDFAVLFGTVQDITEKRQSERTIQALARVAERRVHQLTRLGATLRQSQRALEEALDFKGDFLATVSHNIRTPLNGILGMLELLASGVPEGESHSRLTVAREAAKQLDLYIGDIAEMAYAEDKALESSPQPVQIRQLFDHLMQFWQYAHAQPDPLLRLAVDQSVPQAVVIDPHRCRQIMDVLIGRLIRDGGPVHLHATFNDGHLTIRLSTLNGRPGLLDDGTTRYPLMQRIPAAIGGTLTRIDDAGAIGVVLTLPVGPAPEQDEGSTRASMAPLRVEARRPRLLVVDDIDTNRLVLTQFLDLMGCDWVTADDGDVAVEQALAGGFDAILMDIRMPRLSGVEATCRIRAASDATVRSVPIIAVTAHANRAEREGLESQGFTAALSKPVDARVLRTSLQAIFAASPPGAGVQHVSPSLADDRPSPAAEGAEGAASQSRDMPIDKDYFQALFKPLASARRDLLLKAAVDDLERLITDIERGYVEENLDLTARAAHSLKGVAGNFGAFALMEAVQVYRDLPKEEAGCRLPELQAQVAGVIEHARDLFATLDRD
ncbi:response regulator [Salinicola aestuarinus]|uniref:response regulator n=1 Tax=Salinicola aestuarinus TaxID=1949082 RepID=UPI00165F6263|nr:response regulator [Salinicola aestuarinus]